MFKVFCITKRSVWVFQYDRIFRDTESSILFNFSESNRGVAVKPVYRPGGTWLKRCLCFVGKESCSTGIFFFLTSWVSLAPCIIFIILQHLSPFTCHSFCLNSFCVPPPVCMCVRREGFLFILSVMSLENLLVLHFWKP